MVEIRLLLDTEVVELVASKLLSLVVKYVLRLEYVEEVVVVVVEFTIITLVLKISCLPCKSSSISFGGAD